MLVPVPRPSLMPVVGLTYKSATDAVRHARCQDQESPSRSSVPRLHMVGYDGQESNIRAELAFAACQSLRGPSIGVSEWEFHNRPSSQAVARPEAMRTEFAHAAARPSGGRG